MRKNKARRSLVCQFLLLVYCIFFFFFLLYFCFFSSHFLRFSLIIIIVVVVVVVFDATAVVVTGVEWRQILPFQKSQYLEYGPHTVFLFTECGNNLILLLCFCHVTWQHKLVITTLIKSNATLSKPVSWTLSIDRTLIYTAVQA